MDTTTVDIDGGGGCGKGGDSNEQWRAGVGGDGSHHLNCRRLWRRQGRQSGESNGGGIGSDKGDDGGGVSESDTLARAVRW